MNNIGETNPKIRAGKYKRTREDLINELSERNPTVEIVGEYVNTQIPITCRCRTCGTEWSARPSKLLMGQACPKCRYKKISKALQKSHSAFVEEMAEIMPTISIVGTYEGWAKRIRCYCKVCGNEWDAIPNNLRKNEGCPECGRKKLEAFAILNRKPHEQFVFELRNINPKIKVVGEYRRDAEKVECECLECGKRWFSLPSNLLKGSGCPACARRQTSFLENFLLLSLRSVLGSANVLSRNRTAIGRELDIYIPSLKTGIEPGSWYWHKPRLEKDKEKYDLCHKNGIRLIILYDSFNDDCDILTLGKDVLTCSKNLGNKSEKSKLIEYTIKIFDLLGLEYSISEKDEQEIIVEARKASTRKTTGQVMDELSLINPNIELISPYTGSKEKLSCRCKVCGNEWLTNRDHLILRRQGCPVCNSPKRPVINLDTGDTYESASEAARKMGVTMSAIRAACIGKSKICRGFHWAYI